MEIDYDRIALISGISKSELKELSWKEIVNEILLPRMAGLPETRQRIGDSFMSFMAYNAKECVFLDKELAMVLLEIAMQRLSNGAVLHEPTSWETLPEAYKMYSSKWDEPGIMSEGCYKFINQALPLCLRYDETREHALKIFFGLISHLDEKGNIDTNYLFPSPLRKMAGSLYCFAKSQIEGRDGASFEEIFNNYARPGQWEKHKIWFANNGDQINWKKFFQAIRVKGILRKYRIKKEIFS